MNVGSWLVWGFAATVVLTILLAASQGLGLTRMNIPYLLGTMLTADRDRAKVYGVLIHLLNGWIFSLVYARAFDVTGLADWWFGAAIGAVHGAFVLAVGLPVLPGLHPRMARELQGPQPVTELEPPGFLGLHYGVQTPISVLVAHVVFGIVLAVFYTRA